MNKEFGLFIKKLRVEGGFGIAMHVILESAPNITDLYLTLDIAGLSLRQCKGPLQRPPICQSIVVDAIEWDKMQTFQFLYLGYRDPITESRAATLISALAKSPSLETLIAGSENGFPEYLREKVDVPSLNWRLRNIREAIKGDAKFEAVVSYPELEDAEWAELENEKQQLENIKDTSGYDSSSRPIIGFCVRGEYVEVEADKLGNYFCPTTSQSPTASNSIDLTPFASLVYLDWSDTADEYWFSTPVAAVSTLALLEELIIRGGIPENFMAQSTPHASLIKIYFLQFTLARSHLITKARKEVVAAIPLFEQLNPENFPMLKQIQIDDIKWPTSEQQARKDPWITLSEIMHQKGIKVSDKTEVSGPTGSRTTMSTGRTKASSRRR
ncbi:hypothetical protein C8R45DRAFT_1220342 [Mycena sanguinolenta]|nr:hypothetical protein C8R45DRAFT_1220342 [Mycena sanguinolenta]